MNKKERAFVAQVWDFYKKEGRTNLPWRHTHDPYNILVSEVMCQQTQVDRVIDKYQTFIKRFPGFRTLNRASLGDVLVLWQGLGYNRRARYLHECAQVVCSRHGRKMPHTFDELKQLPGVGPYTAGAVLAFAYNEPTVLIETNIRTVFIKHFFNMKTKVSDQDIQLLVERTLDRDNPRAWYSALMDYGSHIKRVEGNHSQRSRTYQKQSQFRGSNREIRGAILRELAEGSESVATLNQILSFPKEKVEEQLANLCTEGLVVKQQRRYSFPY